MQSQGYTEDECYRKLRTAIVDGTLMPAQRLVEMDLARWLGASRATVRTVLARLEQEGLVERERYRGARVRHVSHEEAVEILEVRMALECIIARYAAERATDDEIDKIEELLGWMREKFEEGDLVSYSEGNARLHRTIAEMSRHSTARRLLDTLNSQNVRYQYRTILAPGRSHPSLQEHTAIVQAIAGRDADAAEQAMRKHLSHVCDTLRKMRSGP